jgi:hypothetical protein
VRRVRAHAGSRRTPRVGLPVPNIPYPTPYLYGCAAAAPGVRSFHATATRGRVRRSALGGRPRPCRKSGNMPPIPRSLAPVLGLAAVLGLALGAAMTGPAPADPVAAAPEVRARDATGGPAAAAAMRAEPAVLWTNLREEAAPATSDDPTANALFGADSGAVLEGPA